ncbi:MAG: cell division ATP-binding protein FtsE [Nitrospirae bacterium]|nr:cell division ATP-binding protein FtsE [Nitrospirota bacterium]
MIQFRNVSKSYDNLTALRGVTLSVPKGEMAFVTGPSGSGKSTLLKLIYLAEKPDTGSIVINAIETAGIRESDIPYLRRNIGVVFQDFRLLMNKTIFDNIALALRIRLIPESEIKSLVHEVLKMVNLRHKANSYPAELSGGEQQRVVIARALVGEPLILLADEPTGNLDVDTASGIMRIFKEINTRGTTLLVATHNKELYRYTGKTVHRLDNGNLVEEAVG